MDKSVFSGELKQWLLAALLVLPAVIPYLAHFMNVPSGMVATGYIQYDMPYYMANARETEDSESWLTYGNPFSPEENTPSIYFQPMTLVLSLLLRLFDFPATLFLTLGGVAAVTCMRIGLSLIDLRMDSDGQHRNLIYLLFAWGGGLLTVASLLVGIYGGLQPHSWLFNLDPFYGWWFLNFGRNLIFPHESLYHLLFFLVILFAVRKRYKLSLTLAAVLSLSHPFTGIQCLLVMLVWASLESYFLESNDPPKWYIPALIAIIAFHLLYYLVFLPSHHEHRILMQQWSLPWVIKAESFVPAYILVGGMALYQLRTITVAREALSSNFARLMVVGAVVSFVLENHEFAISPIQPLHFTRGYTWIFLFLFCVPTLVSMFTRVARIPSSLRGIALSAILGIFLLDNLVWLGAFPTGIHYLHGGDNSIVLTESQSRALDVLAKIESPGLVLGQDEYINYLATVDTSHRTWYSHRVNTPYARERRDDLVRLFSRGEYLGQWDSRNVYVVIRNEYADNMLNHLKHKRPQIVNRELDHSIIFIPPSVVD